MEEIFREGVLCVFTLHWTFLLLIPAIAFSLYAQHKVGSTFRAYSEVPALSGLTGSQAAAELARRRRVPVRIEPHQGFLSDHFDPTTNTLALSPDVYYGRSLASLGVAAHELGHALQKQEGYWPLALRAGLVPIANFGSGFAVVLLLLGMLMQLEAFQTAGILLFSGAVLFALVTLPVEFDASRRALQLLSSEGLVAAHEAAGVRRVLDAAALTYVAAAVMAVTELVRLILIARSDD